MEGQCLILQCEVDVNNIGRKTSFKTVPAVTESVGSSTHSTPFLSLPRCTESLGLGLGLGARSRYERLRTIIIH